MNDTTVPVCDRDYTHSDVEFEEMWQLLVDSLAMTDKPHNWSFAELENWCYATWDEPSSFFASRVHLWRNGAGELIGFCNLYYETTHLQIHPEYRFVEGAMLDWVECNWGNEKGQVETRAYQYDKRRKDLLRQREYEDLGACANMHVYDLSEPYSVLDLPPGFRIASLAENGDYDGRIATERATFNSDYLDRNWFNGKSSAPSYAFDWDLGVISPEGQHVAFALVWLDGQSHSAQIDPVGTHPDYRRRGFAKALLSDCFRRLRAAGIRRVYIESAPEPNISNRLYDSLQPVARYQANRWTKHLSAAHIRA